MTFAKKYSEKKKMPQASALRFLKVITCLGKKAYYYKKQRKVIKARAIFLSKLSLLLKLLSPVHKMS